MPRRILHISNSPYRSLEDAGPSYSIFKELAAGTTAYHILAQNVDRAFAEYSENGLHMHLVPALSAKEFALLAYSAMYLVPRYRLDGVLCQDPVLGGVAGLHAARLFRVPIMVEVHSDVYFSYRRSPDVAHRAIGMLAEFVLKRATRVRASGDRLARELVNAGVDKARIVSVPYRVDTEFFDPAAVDRSECRTRLGYDENELVAVSIGRFVEQKGYLGLLEAFTALSRRNSSCRLVLAGGGPLQSEYEKAIASNRLEEVVRLESWVSRTRQRELLASADVYVQPSVPGKGDWMPRTILEAMAMRVPIVATALGGIPDVIEEGKNGVLVAGGDACGLVRSLETLFADPSRRTALAMQARADAVRKYRWDECFRRYREALYDMPVARR